MNTVQGDGGSVLIWACFCHDKLAPCIVVDSRMNSTVYINDILKPFHRKFYSNLVRKIPNLVLMQDNAPCHTSGQTRKWLTQKKIKLLTWPPPKSGHESHRVPLGYPRETYQCEKQSSKEFKRTKRSTITRMERTTCANTMQTGRKFTKKTSSSKVSCGATNKVLRLVITRCDSSF